MKILIVTSEVAPFSRSGGLGLVCASLPAALAALGHHLIVVSPR
ncbi:MAG: glycogen/starch synthase, partial [Myxococcota bacterium]